MESIMLRMLLALVAGALIGIDREVKRRGAGLKTYALVCLGAALVMMTGQYIYIHFDGSMDIARLGAQVISGVGFLGVGTILVTRNHQIRGLTTAAGIWTCACLGLAIGIGFVEGAIFAFFLILFTLKFFSRLDYWLHSRAKVFDLYVEFSSNKGVSLFIQEVRTRQLKICNLEISTSQIKGEGPNAIVRVEVQDKKKRGITTEMIRMMEYVSYVEEL